MHPEDVEMASDRAEILRGLKVYHCTGDTFKSVSLELEKPAPSPATLLTSPRRQMQSWGGLTNLRFMLP